MSLGKSKKPFLAILFIFSIHFCFGQNVAIAVSKQNRLIVNLHNRLEVAVENVPNNKLILKTNNGKIIKDEYGFIVIPKEFGIATISIYKENKNDTIFIAERQFRVGYISIYAQASVSLAEGGEISQNQLRTSQGLKSYATNLDIDLSFPIISFKCMLLRNDSLIFVKKNMGRKFNDELKKGFELCKAGDYIYFFDIKGTGAEGETFKMTEIKLKIK